MTVQAPQVFLSILQNLQNIIHGKATTLQQLLIAFFAGGHILLEDVPGVGKTTAAKALALSVSAKFHRLQFTPDLLPADITGVTIYNPKSGEFSFRPGPVFADILLADEINRASPRTQSALLEAMSERQVSVEGKSLDLGKIFTVLATQNPVEFHGTYPLPEAQLDRFCMRLAIGYPPPDDELAMLRQQQYQHPLSVLQPVVAIEEILAAREQVKAVKVGECVNAYLMAIVTASRREARLKLGISPRGSLAFYRTSQAMAWSEGRDYVIPDDLKSLAVPVLAHRLLLETKARHSGITKKEIIREILHNIAVPI